MKIETDVLNTQSATSAPAAVRRLALLPTVPTRTDYLPVSVGIAEDERTLQEAISLRHAAYARHVPQIAQALTRPEQADLLGIAPVFVVQNKLDRGVVATMRAHVTDDGPTPMQKYIDLPAWLQSYRLSESLRFATHPAGSRLATHLLFKAFYFYCLARAVDYMVVCARAPVDRIYDRLGFTDVFGEREYINMPHGGNLPHRVLMAKVQDFEPTWRAQKHPLYDFVFTIHHAELDWIFATDWQQRAANL